MLLLSALSLLLIQRLVGVSGTSCGCSSLVIPVHVDVLVPKDPADPFGGLKNVVQLLVHGFSYTNQFWSPPVEEFRNYSYTAFACERGVASFAIDALGSGLSTRPENAVDVQYANSAAVISQLGRHLQTASIIPGVKPFKKVIGIGHSLGSGFFSFGAIVDGAKSPFDALILTAQLIFGPNDAPPGSGGEVVPVSARDSNPVRWGGLDAAYITINERTFFYPADPNASSPRMVAFDAFVRDAGSMYMNAQGASTSIPAENYTGAVAKIVGSADQALCDTGAGRCADAAALSEAERVGWPAAQSFELVVSEGSSHDLVLDFKAGEVFGTIFGFVEKFVGRVGYGSSDRVEL
ncbi:hypothetical protein C8R43DRAFT_881596 [Mycena crocata]|nr:hypothetical protein C8R43DRAFT_881596 [Mycena crocata]